jgi:hypothetical protein
MRHLTLRAEHDYYAIWIDNIKTKFGINTKPIKQSPEKYVEEIIDTLAHVLVPSLHEEFNLSDDEHNEFYKTIHEFITKLV